MTDVIVTDGFTGNVALKTLEGSMRFLIGAAHRHPRPARASSRPPMPSTPTSSRWPPRLDPENTGGAMLLGVDGVCVISHGSSSSVAIVNAITVAHDLAVGGLVDAVAASVTPPGARRLIGPVRPRADRTRVTGPDHVPRRPSDPGARSAPEGGEDPDVGRGLACAHGQRPGDARRRHQLEEVDLGRESAGPPRSPRPSGRRAPGGPTRGARSSSPRSCHCRRSGPG